MPEGPEARRPDFQSIFNVFSINFQSYVQSDFQSDLMVVQWFLV